MIIILQNIKNMLRRPLIFCILILGLIVGSFAQVVYYVSCTKEIRLGQVAFNRHKVVEFSGVFDEAATKSLTDMILNGSLPEIQYAGFVSYQKEDYDVVAVVWNENIPLDTGGEYISESHLGKKVATVSANIWDTNVKTGDSIRVNGYSVDVVGVMPPGAHNPVLYDIRRMPGGAEYVAGVSVERDAFLLQRPQEAVIIPLDMMTYLNIRPSYCHIAFTDELSQAQREDIEALIKKTVSYCSFTDLSVYSEIDYINFIGKAIVSVAAVFAGIINVVALFSFFIRENKKQYLIYKMHGATNLRIIALILLELAIYTLVSFSIGWMGAAPFIWYSGFVNVYMPFGINEFILLYILLYCVAVAICWKQIQSAPRMRDSGNKRRIIKKKERQRRVHSEEGTNSKFLYLVSFRYAKSRVASTISICFLSMAVSFTLAYAMTYIYEGSIYERYVHRTFPENTNILALFDETKSAFMGGSSETGPKRYAEPFYQEFIEAVQSLPACTAVGEVRDSVWAIDASPQYGEADIERHLELRQVNSEYINHSPIPLQQGSWDPLLSYEAGDEAAPIPCIVSPYLKDRFPVGHTFTLKVNGNASDPDAWMQERSFVVAGVANDASFTVIGNGLGPQLTPNITGYLRSFSSDTGQSGVFFAQQIYVPILQQNNASLAESYPPLYVLYTDEDEAEAIPQWRLHLNRYASTVSIQECLDNYMEQFRSGGGNIYFMHAAVASALLILGVGGYSIMLFAANKRTYGIYYVCGMPWSKAAGLTVAGNALDMLLPAAVGAVAGVYVSQGIRVFDETTIALSILTGLGAVAAVYALTSAIIALSMRKARPKRLMTADGQ